MHALRRRRTVLHHDPFGIVIGAADDVGFPFEPLVQKCDVRARCVVQSNPFGLEIFRRKRLRGERHGVDPDIGNVGPLALADDFLVARRKVDPNQRRFVSSHRIEHQKSAGALLERDRPRRHGVLERDVHDLRPTADVLEREHFRSAARQRAHGQADDVVAIGHEIRKLLRVALNQSPLAADNVHGVYVVPFRVTLVEPDQHDIRLDPAHAHDLRLNAFQRGQILVEPGRDFDAVQSPILVALLILKIENVVAVRRPIVLADAARRIAGDRLGFRERSPGRNDEHIHVTFERREERNVCARGRDARLRPLRITEQHGSRNERRF